MAPTDSRSSRRQVYAAHERTSVLLAEQHVSWFVDPHVRWRHPVARILVALLILALDFYIYGEDPVQDSGVEYVFPVLGHIYGLLCVWPEEAHLVALRSAIVVLFFLLGLYIGRQFLHHRLLRDCLGLLMFEGNKGTLAAMVVTLPVSLTAGAIVNNAIVTGGVIAPISSRTFKPFYEWGKTWQYLSVLLDVVTVAQVVDEVLQDRRVYPTWAKRAKHLWNEKCKGRIRIVVFWAAFPTVYACLALAISNTGYEKGSIRWSLGGLDETQRTAIVSLIIICDVVQVAQDWQFPTFDRPFEILVVGTAYHEITFVWLERAARYLCCCLRLPPKFWVRFRFSMTGGWIMYGPLLGSLLADISCGSTQFRYEPSKYGQYVSNSSSAVFGIRDPVVLQAAYENGVLVRPELVTYAARAGKAGQHLNSSSGVEDVDLYSQYSGVGTLAALALVPGIAAMLAFAVLLWGGERYWRSPAMQCLGQLGEEAVLYLEQAARGMSAALTPRADKAERREAVREAE